MNQWQEEDAAGSRLHFHVTHLLISGQLWEKGGTRELMLSVNSSRILLSKECQVVKAKVSRMRMCAATLQGRSKE